MYLFQMPHDRYKNRSTTARAGKSAVSARKRMFTGAKLLNNEHRQVESGHCFATGGVLNSDNSLPLRHFYCL
jgi:hypothetical protein